MAQITFWDEQLVAEGGYLIARRARVAEALTAAMSRRSAATVTGEAFGVRYEPRVRVMTDALGEDGAEGAVVRANDAFLRDLEAHREDEFRRGMTLTGPHRDDLAYEIDGRSLARFGSRGQQRLGVLALKLAEADVIMDETGETPVFLLDDVLSELDEAHRTALLDELAARHGQVILTSAESAALDHPALADLGVYRTERQTLEA